MNSSLNPDIIEYRKLFPVPSNNILPSSLLIDEKTIQYITTPRYTKKIKQILSYHPVLNKPNNAITIVDATGGAGGDTISFANTYHKVISIENDAERFALLNNNINAYELTNVHTINGNCLDVIPNLDQIDILYMDPPWGGKNYKLETSIRLGFVDSTNTQVYLENFIINCFDANKMKCVPNLIVLKLPLNYNIKILFDTLNPLNPEPGIGMVEHIDTNTHTNTNLPMQYNIYMYKLEKFLIMIIIKNN